MRRRKDRHIQPIRIMPPVIKRRRGKHCNSPPDTKQTSQRTVKDTPDPDLRSLRCLLASEGVVQHPHPREQTRENSTQIDQNMRRRKEFVPADRAVPADIPKHPDNRKKRGQRNRIEVHRNNGDPTARRIKGTCCLNGRPEDRGALGMVPTGDYGSGADQI